MPAVRKGTRRKERVPEGISAGAALAMQRKRETKYCENPECEKEFEGISISRFCSDECRWRAAYLVRKQEEQ